MDRRTHLARQGPMHLKTNPKEIKGNRGVSDPRAARAVVKSSQEQAEAARFVQYVRSAAGQAVLKQYGFAAAH